jgi:hypothetical protein
MKINTATPIVMYIMWIVTREGLSTLLMAVMLELIEDRTLPSAEINDAEEPTPFSDDGIRLVLPWSLSTLCTSLLVLLC